MKKVLMDSALAGEERALRKAFVCKYLRATRATQTDNHLAEARTRMRSAEKQQSTNGDHGHMETRRVHTVWCPNLAELSSRSLENFLTIVCEVKHAEPLVLLDVPSAHRKQREESIATDELSAFRGLV